MMSRFKKFLSFLLVIAFLNLSVFISTTQAEVCFTDEEAVDIITLLEASEHDLELLNSCNQLVEQLYAEIKLRDEHIAKLTDELVKADERYRALVKKRDREKWLRYVGVGAIVVVIAKVAVAL